MAKLANGGKSISPEQLFDQWKTLPNKFQVNINNFEVRAAKAAQEVFQTSFELGRLYTAGSTRWRPRQDRRSHPILKETGTLQRSISWKKLSGNERGVKIFTDPTKFNTAKRHKGFCYAAIHNAPSGTYSYGNKGPSVQRQFIGHSDVLKRHLQNLSSVIFEGFPK